MERFAFRYYSTLGKRLLAFQYMLTRRSAPTKAITLESPVPYAEELSYCREEGRNSLMRKLTIYIRPSPRWGSPLTSSTEQ